ncbi:hypothetical protein ASD77_09170 [Pseudoxanthomonas sp. Root65]|uniref:hypothetical protein n=1 Tax=Pseudoxanthomonas sp. Root65 TaxID=1736576 RepID=UPI0006FABCBA|nr:hypothetical protein [Pseudoxanthomonas sp. Root65]KRA54737.1 hypothetical protein ASD77_09170 [Pseudoxanthomonas sp. Root65]
MRIITSLMSCLLALAGCDDKPSVTTIHHSSANGVDTLFSKSTLKEGVATFECFASESGQCHYRVYTERCAVAATGENPADCTRTTLEDFALAPGKTHEIRGLPEDFRQCVAKEADAGRRCGS